MNDPAPWWETLFSGLVLETMPFMSSEEQTKREADFLEKTMAPAPGAAIADVPCGAGRLSLALAGRGYRLTGVDLTEALLKDARREAAERGLEIKFQRHDMRDLPWRESFDHAFCFGNSFAYFDDAGNRAFLKGIQGILKPGGSFVLETGLAAESFTQPPQRRWYPMGEVYFLHETQFNPSTGQLTSSYTLIKNGQIERKQAVYQVYTCRELLRMFQEAGFTDLQTFGSLEGGPFQLGLPSLWIVGRRI